MDQYGRPVQPVPLSPGNPDVYVPQPGAPGDNFGAIAFSTSSGAIGYSYDYSSGDDAQQSALQNCGYGCRVVLRFTNACGALAVGAGYGYGTGWAGNRQDAKSNALSYCSSQTTGCGIVRWVCTSR
jgi:serine/threonine-protein kinase